MYTITDIASFYENIEFIERMHEPYVIIAPSYMVYAEDYRELLQTHIDSVLISHSCIILWTMQEKNS